MRRLSKSLTCLLTVALSLMLSTASARAEASLSCIYEVLVDSYEYLAACGVDIGTKRYQSYLHLRSALKDFINQNTTPGKAQIDSAHDESHRELAREAARTERCQGKTLQFADLMFGAFTTEQFTTKIYERLSTPHDPHRGDCL